MDDRSVLGVDVRAERPRPVTVIHGPGGVGKTTLLMAIASTRPGSLLALSGRARGAASNAPFAISDWLLGQDDPERPHVLTLATPGARVHVDDDREQVRRREQVLFDRAARDGGFVWVALPSTRWFSRQPLALTAPGRTPHGYDVRAVQNFDDGARADLTRDTKQALAYAAIAAALNRQVRQPRQSLGLLGDAMREVVDKLLQLSGFSYRGLDPVSLEPEFSSRSGARRSFDELPTQARHLAAIGALPLRALWVAHAGRDPRECEGVVGLDEVELHQDTAAQAGIVPTLRELLPMVQWILTTTSGVVAGSADTREVLALRRFPERDTVEVFVGSDARTH